MGEVYPLPGVGDTFDDVRDGGRRLRVSVYADRGMVVLSLWSGVACRASFRLAAADAERLRAALELPAETAPDPPVSACG
ncbi:hypothetical protein Ais01nite_04930 [Asanoa ishikariensis]|uniref:Uncharacterized protein n=1 Tax=Asanoa ishikariensis TaxID=137265 RepID=A0A1H3TI75_9ACTN|nr:hypothetical protein [Asanoa ishikariensis]GIF62458.1 hypothetical protein Ais01nite_04930 [Asanoa ishikariensis]SDZ49501.1 hypothetical protein SAMN05421684_5739 [Asanoa ishikariensis]